MGKREKMLLYKEIVTREIKLLSYADRCVILIIEKGKSETHGLPSTMINYMLYSISRSLLRVVGGYFFPLKIS